MKTGKRLIKNNFGDYRTLSVLKRMNKEVPIYDTRSPQENISTARIHNRLHRLREDGLVRYERGYGANADCMCATITHKGIDWLYRKRVDFIIITLTALAAVFAAIAAARPC